MAIPISIKWLPESEDKTKFRQVYETGIEFAFARKKEQKTPFVFCKDFLHSCVFAQLHNRNIDIYGFGYSPQKSSITTKRAYLLVTNSADNKMGEKIEACQDFLRQAERKLHLRRTTICSCDAQWTPYQNCGVYLFRGSRMWLNAPPMLSLYSLLIRVGFCHKIGDCFTTTLENVRFGKVPPYQRNDSYLINASSEGINRIFALGYRKFFFKDIEKNYPVSVDIEVLHNYFGIVGFSQLFKQTKPNYYDTIPKYWHRKSLPAFRVGDEVLS